MADRIPRWASPGWRYRLWYRWRLVTRSDQMLNRRVDVENVLLNTATGKRPPLTREQCRALAMYLGDPTIPRLVMPDGVKGDGNG